MCLESSQAEDLRQTVMVVAVLENDPAETLEDAADYSFGVQFEQGAENMQAAVTEIQNQLGDGHSHDRVQFCTGTGSGTVVRGGSGNPL